jgi:LacI family transcriptional regulator
MSRSKMTMKDIARQLGISITTVSRALNKQPGVGKETRKAVLALAQQYNYSPNEMAASLSKRTSNVIGVVLPRVEHYFFATILKGIIRSAQKDNYVIMVNESSHVPQRESELITQLIGRNVSGIILSPCRNELDIGCLNSLKQNHIPLVLIDRAPKNYQGHYVKMNDFHGAEIAVKHLLQQGYKKVAHIRGHEYSSIAQDRFEGYKNALKNNHIDFDPALVKTCELVNTEEGYYFTKELLLSDNKPDAIFAVTDEVALGVYQALEELHLKIPDDVGVMGFSNSIISNHVCPKMSTVDQPGNLMGETAYEFLKGAMENEEQVKQKIFEAKLLIRQSTLRKPF